MARTIVCCSVLCCLAVLAGPIGGASAQDVVVDWDDGVSTRALLVHRRPARIAFTLVPRHGGSVPANVGVSVELRRTWPMPALLASGGAVADIGPSDGRRFEWLIDVGGGRLPSGVYEVDLSVTGVTVVAVDVSDQRDSRWTTRTSTLTVELGSVARKPLLGGASPSVIEDVDVVVIGRR